tara:strand:- start:257 stop:1219 length:963 start_codon:yes stop_codon:yes gene_type:complete
MKALSVQLKNELEQYDKKVETIFIGGGTPSTIEAKEYKKLLALVHPYLIEKCEITIEANPNSANKEWLEDISKIGINRISFGVQSFDDEKLNFLGRNHSSKEAIEAINNAKNAGFENINCDIIYDTQLDTKKLLENDINIIKKLPINHISAYSLTLEKGTKFFNKKNVQLEDEKLARWLFDEFNVLGFEQYEISNFALNDKARSKHNLGYWQYKEYLGVGSGAVGCLENKRYYSQKDVKKYILNPLEYEDIETLSKDDVLIEKVLLGFRSVVGIDMNLFDKKVQEKLVILNDSEKVKIENKRVYAKDFMLADELSLYLDI